ncbi:MAG: cupin domain-containing protein [Luteolibacter sp.]|uniref:JmjC domain-containing protein n=1 Tax=Luteolibacter sp. TaxID=1962973 RepID=UPI003265C09B
MHLAAFLGEISVEHFFAEIWGKSPAVLKLAGEFPVISIEAFNDLFRRIHLGLTNQTLRVVKDQKILPFSAISVERRTKEGISRQVSPELVSKYMQQGATLVLRSIRLFEPDIDRLCCGLEQDLRFPISSNLYVTPPNQTGFPLHADDHDVFVLQLSGTKYWLVAETKDTRDELADAPKDLAATLLESGSMIYIPRGHVHEARAGQLASIHLTLGLSIPTFSEIAEQLFGHSVMKEALQRPAFRIDPSRAPEFLADEAKAIFAALISKLSEESLISDLTNQPINTGQAILF